MADASKIILYGTLGCHLCVDAENIVRSVAEHFSLSFVTFDIIDDEQVLAQLGEKIPAVEFRQQQLCWPFTQASLIAWLTRVCEST
jgi:uncharacterized metal-binding protein